MTAPSASVRRWTAVSFAALLLLAPSLRSQMIAEMEIRRHLDHSIEDVVHINRLDRATAERVHQMFQQAFTVPNGGAWLKKEDATTTLEGASRRRSLVFVDNGNGSLRVVDASRERLTDPELRRANAFVVDAVFSSIRRRSILENIGPVAARSIDNSQLALYLKNALNVPDYDQVATSFDQRFKVEVATLQVTTTLLRLSGGISSPVGRYYLCCLFDGRWTDASGLATPPGNLLEDLNVTKVPAGTTVVIGTVADNFFDRLGHARRGGNIQLFVPHAKDYPYHRYPVVDPKDVDPKLGVYRMHSVYDDVPIKAKEITVLVDDDRVLRFRP